MKDFTTNVTLTSSEIDIILKAFVAHASDIWKSAESYNAAGNLERAAELRTSFRQVKALSERLENL